MGTYFNPTNKSFVECTNDPLYVDKTGLLELLNARIRMPSKCIALSHARRFGKSQAAGMIKAYYSCGADSRELFAPFAIASEPDFEKHLNKYNVIHLDITSFTNNFTGDVVERIWKFVYKELKSAIPGLMGKTAPHAAVLMDAYVKTKVPFVIIIDEWDSIVRNQADRPDLVHRYLQFLHSLFKSEESKDFLALGYITGILPIKKIDDESALNNFDEYTMITSGDLTPYFGFTEEEVTSLCKNSTLDFASVKAWYDGYLISGWHIYNPNSVCSAIRRRKIAPYWKNTAAFGRINQYLKMGFDGLQEDIVQILAKETVEVTPDNFTNDLSQIETKDDVLAALIHLGYLAYDEDSGRCRLPNVEVGQSYQQALKNGKWKKIADAITRSEEILDATIHMDTEKVAELLDTSHEKYSSILTYNDENSLACAIHMAYFTADVYYTIVRELPAGKGFADFAFIPRREAGSRPAMIVELKWKKKVDTAIRQIKERRYAGALAGCSRDILLVGINYDDESPNKKHSCIIETFREE